MNHTPEKIRSALTFIPASTDRDEWARVGMGIKSEYPDSTGFELFDAWSQTDPDGYNPADVSATWRSIQAAGGVTIGTLFHLAKANGYTPTPGTRPDPAMQQQLAGERAARELLANQERKQRQQQAAQVAAQRWQAATPANDGHPYLSAKGVQAHGVKLEGAALLVPMRDTAGHLHGLQVIDPEGGKRFQPGGRVTGCYHAIGKPKGTLIVCEGYATGASIHEATGHAVAVAFNAGNLEAVALALRQKYPALRLILATDDDWKTDGNPGMAKATAAARAVGGWLAVPTFPADRPDKATDFNDLHQLAGLEAVQACIDAAHPVATAETFPALPEAGEPPAPALPRYKLLTAADLDAMQPLQWRIKGVAPTRGLMQVYGPSKAGKSFLAFDMACAIAEGSQWFGYRVNAAPVVYVALEGEAGFKLRAQAWIRHNSRPLPENLRLVMQPFRINHAKDVQDLADVVPDGAVIMVDTQNRAAPDADENSARDMGAIIEGAKTLQGKTDGLVALVAHTGKDARKGPRGHSSQIPAVDAAIEVSRNGDRRTWRAEKVKDGADGAEHAFRLEVIEMGKDDDGDSLTSCAVSIDELAPRHKPMTEGQRLGNSAYCVACDDGHGLLDADGNFIGLHLEAWRPLFYAMSPADNPEAKKKSFQRARKDLVNDRLATVVNDVYRVTMPITSVRESYFKKAAEKAAEKAAQDRDTGQDRDITGTSPDHQAGQAGHGSLDMSRCPDGDPI